MQPVLKARAFLLVNEFIFGDEEAREKTKAQINVLVSRRPGKVQEIQEGREHREGIERMAVAFPFRKATLFVDDEFIDEHDDPLKDERQVKHQPTSNTAPIMVRPGPKAIATTGVPFSGGSWRISCHTCGRVAEDMFPLS